MKSTYTLEEVQMILVSTLMFSNANNNQGLTKVSGNNYGEQALTIINANDSIVDTSKSLLSVLQLFTK